MDVDCFGGSERQIHPLPQHPVDRHTPLFKLDEVEACRRNDLPAAVVRRSCDLEGNRRGHSKSSSCALQHLDLMALDVHLEPINPCQAKGLDELIECYAFHEESTCRLASTSEYIWLNAGSARILPCREPQHTCPGTRAEGLVDEDTFKKPFRLTFLARSSKL